jgi:hypothetical protein
VHCHGKWTRVSADVYSANCFHTPAELRQFHENAYFMSTCNGWMTQHGFLKYAHFLVHELNEYRRMFPLTIAGERFLLVLDGHSSRFTIEVVQFLDGQGVDVLVLPAHCTHVLQAFDVGLASPLKTKLAKLCQQAAFTVNEENSLELGATLSTPGWLAEKRAILFDAFLSAWNETATVRNIMAAFATVAANPLLGTRLAETDLRREIEAL